MKNRRLRWLKVESLVTDRVLGQSDPKALRESIYSHARVNFLRHGPMKTCATFEERSIEFRAWHVGFAAEVWARNRRNSHRRRRR